MKPNFSRDVGKAVLTTKFMGVNVRGRAAKCDINALCALYDSIRKNWRVKIQFELNNASEPEKEYCKVTFLCRGMPNIEIRRLAEEKRHRTPKSIKFVATLFDEIETHTRKIMRQQHCLEPQATHCLLTAYKKFCEQHYKKK